MSNEIEPTTQDAVPDRNSISEDLMCLSCGYNLRGLARRGDCPECGLPITQTILARQGMTKRELTALAFRVSALCYAFSTLADLVELFRFGRIPWWYTLLTWLFGLGVMGLLFVVWSKAALLAKLTVRTDGPITLSGRLNSDQVMSVALGIIGVIYIIRGTVGLVWILTSILIDLDSGNISNHYCPNVSRTMTTG